jgi:hypothetical protein
MDTVMRPDAQTMELFSAYCLRGAADRMFFKWSAAACAVCFGTILARLASLRTCVFNEHTIYPLSMAAGEVCDYFFSIRHPAFTHCLSRALTIKLSLHLSTLS